MNELFDAINLLDNTVENANAKDIFEAISLIAANSNLIGLNEKSAAAISSTMLSTGKATSVVGTSLNALFTRLDTAESQSKAFQEALKQIGLDAKTLKANLQKDAEGTIVDFLDRINKAPKQMRSGLLYDLVGGNFNDGDECGRVKRKFKTCLFR
ncbi:phage tail tape measure protein [uncultured Campylobacter sp.]|uniref:phage tail tape measure protein n=1 Tax=uncultured Campylobacter sp. TaxID=218934 RepID=UPI002602DADF|nr:phage tail tape measure protein [uncultured Campylobacter sp.]